ncbi:MAG: hypothetical protein A2X56_13540 [Nitrospirae bacterium GWC2_57_13]|jgi:uncharacterized protein YndB with AHSA1/START domain|nr:MAG: hypothetical protein A2072_04150 [Nitrospirae bacterium GWC1_57_7]OGW29779.1 MAG: hypothetical protein A2X56_13540 [Nitrospirae bacterium GWC2_57_13]OGW46757.1 MAG: hypothetical protein A2X57_05870 [Nitrospirae bacterium GWD2_57_8]
MATLTENRPATKPVAQELVITRVFDAPRELLWKAWTEPERVMRWWGPKHFTAPVSKIDLRVGGKYLSCMRSPDGKDYWSTGVYREIVPLERLVMTDSFADEKGSVVPGTHYGMSPDFPLEMLVTVTFEGSGSRTKMTMRHEGIPGGKMRELTREGWNGSFDKLAGLLTEGNGQTRVIAEPGKQEVVITRVFDAPRDIVFKAYTDPNRIPQWWGPKRFTTAIDKMDVRRGGIWRFIQHDAEGREYAFHGVYHEVRSPVRLVQTFEFEGTPGQVSLETATFEEQNGRTRVTNRSVFQSVEDRDEMLKEGMEEGVTETMDRLAEVVAKAGIGKKAA